MLLIGIAGGSGSGKTTVVKNLKERLNEHIVVIPQDSYYKDLGHLPPDERQAQNFDHPNAIDWDLLVQQLKELKEGKTINQPIYSYLTCTRDAEKTIKVEPSPIIIVEGILIFNCKELRDQLDIMVFVDADDDDRLSRIVERDIVERGKTVQQVLRRYERTVKPMHIQYIAPSKRYADIIVPQGGENKVAINMLTATIKSALGE